MKAPHGEENVVREPEHRGRKGAQKEIDLDGQSPEGHMVHLECP